MANRKKKDFPNNWEPIRQTDSEAFDDDLAVIELLNRCPVLRPGFHAIIRAKSVRNGKVKEFAYKQCSSFVKKLESLLDDHHELHVVTDEVEFSYRPDTRPEFN